MATVGTLHTAFVEDLRDTYDAERQLTKVLPKMAKAATSPDLRAAIESHLRETRTHVERVEAVLASLDERASGKRCDGMSGILEEGMAVMRGNFDDATMDARLIAAGQRVEHYEISAYGTLVAWAKAMDHAKAVDLLQRTLDEEKNADKRLSAIAEGSINREAANRAHN
jgi:ferritin-like metal-binding protein YciE